MHHIVLYIERSFEKSEPFWHVGQKGTRAYLVGLGNGEMGGSK